MVDPFSVRIAIRSYELDAQGHVNGAVYLQYAEPARRECQRAAEVTNVGGVLGLETRRLLPDPGAHVRRLATTPALPGR